MSVAVTEDAEKELVAKKAEQANKSINLNRIKSAKTKDFLLKFGFEKHADLAKMRPECYVEGVNDDFYKHSKFYDVPHGIEKVWDAYINIPPAISWAGRRIIFSFAYDPEPNTISYVDDVYSGLKVNQSIFLEVRVLFGLVKLPVTHMVNKISVENKTMKLCYGHGGKSAGSQMIFFEKISETETRVIHNTHYKSGSKFRDEKLYPILHERIINDFHHNIHRYLDC